jgi:hypothetical protein
MFLHLEARVRVGRGLTHSKESLSLLMVQYSKDTCVKKTNIQTICKKLIGNLESMDIALGRLSPAKAADARGRRKIRGNI